MNQVKYNTNLEHKIPPFLINNCQMKNLNFLRNNNNCQKKSSIYATESNLNKQKSLTQKEYANLFKLNNELNTNFNNTNHNLHFKSFQSRRNTNKESRSNSHFYLTSKLNSPENNAIKTFFHYNNRNLSNDKSPKANNIVKSSGLKKNQNLKTESDTELINLDKYNSLVTETMINYRTESMPIDSNNLENREDNLPTFKESIGLNKTLFGKNNNNLNFTYGENYNIKIDVKDKEYRNPIDSRKIIYTNKNIFDNISTSLINIKLILYIKNKPYFLSINFLYCLCLYISMSIVFVFFDSSSSLFEARIDRLLTVAI